MLLAAVSLLLCGAFAAITWYDYEAALEEAWADAERAALTASEHAGRGVGAARLVTYRVADAIRREGPSAFRGAGHAALRALLSDQGQIGSLWILDAAGRVVANSLDPEPPEIDLSDRSHVGALRQGREQALAPMRLGRQAPDWAFALARGVRGADGELLAMVVVMLHADDFQRVQRGLGLGPNGRVGAFAATDGAPLMLSPLPGAADASGLPRSLPLALPDAALRAASAGGQREGRVAWTAPDGTDLLVAWRVAAASAPIIAAAGLPRGDALAPFRHRLLRNSVLFAIALGVVATLGAAVAAALARGARTRNAAEARQRELAAVLEATADGVLALNAAWRITFVNARAAAVLAAGRDLRGLVFWDAFPELPSTPFAAACRRTMEQRAPAVAEAPWPGLGRRFRADSHPREDGGVVIFFHDVTQEHEAATRVAESEARFRAMADNIPQLAWMARPDGWIFWFNRRWFDYTGTTQEAMQGQGWRVVHHPEHVERVSARLSRAFDGGHPWEDTFPLRGKDGRYRWFLSRAMPVRDAEGRIALWFGTHTDVTGQRAAQAALRESEARLRLAQEAAEIGIFERVLPNTWSHWSASMFRLYGIDPATRDSPLVEEVEHLALLLPEDRELHAARRRAMREEPGQSRFAFEFRIRRADTGEVRWLVTRGEVVRDDQGRPRVIRGVNYDVTDRRRSEERQLLLAREVDHRAKNALAVVQSIVGLTRHADPAQFRAAVTGRIAAMARAHTLLARDGWDSAELRELVEAELAPHRSGPADPADRVATSGPPLALAPGAAQPLAMALHELATNAAKYGALSSPSGRVAIAWQVTEDGGLALRWTERGGPPLEGPPTQRGFGSSVIRNTIERQLGGRVETDWPREGLVATLTLPPRQLRWPARLAAE